MAEEGRALYVNGLPADVDHERLRDKLLIHFLRARNGGGDVKSVTVISGDPKCALITFEESKVVQSVLRHHPHIIELDGKKYELSLSLPSQEPLSLNKVILDMIVTVDCSQLPQGAEALNVLCCKFPGLRRQPGLIQQTCTLRGIYSEVQDALSYMQRYLGLSQNLSRTKYPDLSGNSRQAPETKEDHGSQKQQRWPSFAQQSPGFYTGDVGTVSTVGSGQQVYGLKNTSEPLTQCGKRGACPEKTKGEEGAKCRMDETDLEDLSLIMEADVFAYLQSNKVYKRILRDHGVQVVHVTSEGVTNLYLQSEVPTGSEVAQNMRQAHRELRQLYLQQENCLRKDQLQKSNLYLPGGLTAALKNVQSVLPNVLLSYDQDNVYIVGEKSEVSQAKQMLLLGVGMESVIGSLTEMQPSSFSSPLPSSDPLETGQQKKKSEVHTPMTPKLIGSNTERKGEGGKEYKLAARFKSSGLGGMGLCAKEEMGGDPKSMTARSDMLMLNSQSTPPIRSSPSTTGILSHELTSDGTQMFRLTGPNCTGEDVLFKSRDPLSSVNTFGSSGTTSIAKSTTSPGFTSTLTTGVNALLHTSVNTEVKTATPSTIISVTTKSPLRRTSSFSGQPCRKEQVQKNQIAAGPMIDTHACQRARSNSLSGGRVGGGFSVSTVEAELTVSSVMWNYVKEAYCNQVDSMKSDLQMSEKQVGRSEVSVILKGPDSSKVEENHRKLQNLVAMVASDFCVQELRLAEIGRVEKDEVVEACCSDVQSRFPKVILHTLMDRVFFLGPKLLCSQVSGILREVFTGKESVLLNKYLPLEEGVDQGTTKASLSTTVDQMSRRPTKEAHSRSDQGEKELLSQGTNETLLSNSNQTKWKSGDQSTKHKSTTLEMVEKSKSMKDELSKTNSISQLTDARENETGLRSDEQTSLPLRAHKKEDPLMTLKQTNLLSHRPSEHCVCGASGPDVKRTSCGVILCIVCLPRHSHCSVCGTTDLCSQTGLENPIQSFSSKDIQQNQKEEYQLQEQHSEKECSKDQKGIHGTVTFLEMPLGLPGHPRYTTAKITYCIPDGIQGDNDPCPGSSFKGGLFEAYLPLSPRGRALLPCLEKAFHQGLTFTVSASNKVRGGSGSVTWGKIPHKIRMEGGRSRNAYPDSTYLIRLSEALVAHGIEGVPASQDHAKS